MSVGLKANADGSGAIQVGGTDAINLSTGLNATFVQNADLPNTFGFKNRIINGAMVIDQRNAGAALTVNSGATNFFACDRFSSTGQATDGVFTIQQSSTAPTGFTNSLLSTVTTADASVGASQYYIAARQKIEGLNVADLGWGTASAATVTLSFWVRSSVTGTFGGALLNSAANRSYPFTYTINSANTWEKETITIAGDTSGTWLTTNGVGIDIIWSIGMGSTLSGTAGAWAGATYFSATGATNLMATNGATIYITGVQLEKGTTATSFDYRDYGTELFLAQRYFQIYNVTGANSQGICQGQCYTTTAAFGAFNAPVIFRSVPTLTLTGTTGCYNAAAGNAGGTVALDVASTVSTIRLNCTSATGLVAGNATGIYVSGSGSSMAFSAEL